MIIEYKDIYKDAIEKNLSCATEVPYFEGDFWPNVLEESIKVNCYAVKVMTAGYRHIVHCLPVVVLSAP